MQVFNSEFAPFQEIAALSLNAFLHLWDAGTFTQVSDESLLCRSIAHG